MWTIGRPSPDHRPPVTSARKIQWSPDSTCEVGRHSRWPMASSSTVGPSWEGEVSNPSNAGAPGSKPLPKCFNSAVSRFTDEIEHERLAVCEPIANVPLPLDRDRNHRRVEAGLHHPTGEHSGFLLAVASGQDIDAAGDSSQGGVGGGVVHEGRLSDNFFTGRPSFCSTLWTLEINLPEAPWR